MRVGNPESSADHCFVSQGCALEGGGSFDKGAAGSVDRHAHWHVATCLADRHVDDHAALHRFPDICCMLQWHLPARGLQKTLKGPGCWSGMLNYLAGYALQLLATYGLDNLCLTSSMPASSTRRSSQSGFISLQPWRWGRSWDLSCSQGKTSSFGEAAQDRKTK